MYNDGSFAEGLIAGQNSANNNGMFGGDWAWWIVILLLFGYGNNGLGGGNAGFNTFELGRLATTNDVASGFNNSAVLNNLNDLKLGQSSLQNTLCQGFSGVNQTINTNGYETRGAITDLGYRLQDCCCQTQRAIDGVNYNMAKNTCDIVQAGNANTQRIIDFLTSDKIDSLNRELSLAQGQLSQISQTNTIVNALRPTPVPAFPASSLYGYCNSGCGCGTL